MRSPSDQAAVQLFKLAGIQQSSCAILAYAVVLAVDTMEVASGKKDGAAAAFTADDRFFPEVQTRPGNNCFAGRAADPVLSAVPR